MLRSWAVPLCLRTPSGSRKARVLIISLVYLKTAPGLLKKSSGYADALGE